MSKSACSVVLVAVAAVALALPAAAVGKDKSKRTVAEIEQVGHEPLMNRGMNSALAIHGDYAYIGSRTDGSHAGQPQGGIMVVDISRPRRPELLTETPIDAMPGESSRELRVWRSQDILIVLNTNCGAGPTLHHCSTTAPEARNFRFYDISGRNAERPRLITQMEEHTHEFFLWEDPNNRGRALMFGGNAGSTCGMHPTPSCPFAVWDISPVLRGEQPDTLYSNVRGYTRFPPFPAPVQKPAGGLHSLSVSNDGTRAYFALLEGGFAVVDTSDFAAGRPSPQPRPITADRDRPTWPGPGAHSALKFLNRDWAGVSDEVYGTATAPAQGCRWGWARIVRIEDPRRPRVLTDYRLPQNDPDECDRWEPRPRTSYSAHNPTLTPNIAFSTWHSGGFQAVSIRRPKRPFQLAEFFPEPLDEVMLEDPRLSSDPDTGNNEKVVMWSYPIIADGLIYLTDVRNGLYVLKYKGRHACEVRRIAFLEGNSNQGDALCFEPVGRAGRNCD